jgi:NADPH:quinone reductase-like Zn-dependent oxidoreductase
MKAMVYDKYGPPEGLRLQEIEVPSIDVNEVLVKVHAASVNWLDWHFLTGTPILARLMAGFPGPKNSILGIDLAGSVEGIGPKVTAFHPGDEVFGSTGSGCFAEYVCVQTDELQPKPSNLSFEEAAAVGAAASTALHALRDAGRSKRGRRS